jgi:hypothetical protein
MAASKIASRMASPSPRKTSSGRRTLLDEAAAPVGQAAFPIAQRHALAVLVGGDQHLDVARTLHPALGDQAAHPRALAQAGERRRKLVGVVHAHHAEAAAREPGPQRDRISSFVGVGAEIAHVVNWGAGGQAAHTMLVGDRRESHPVAHDLEVDELARHAALALLFERASQLEVGAVRGVARVDGVSADGLRQRHDVAHGKAPVGLRGDLVRPLAGVDVDRARATSGDARGDDGVSRGSELTARARDAHDHLATARDEDTFEHRRSILAAPHPHQFAVLEGWRVG